MQFLSVASHVCAPASSRQALAGLPLPSASGYHQLMTNQCRHSHRGLPPHHIAPMLGAHPAVEGDSQKAALFGSLRASRSGCPSLLRWAAMPILNRAVRSVAASLLLTSLPGCGLMAVEGGYAEPCEVHSGSSWTSTQVSSLQKNIGKYRINLWTSHFYRTKEPGLLLFVGANSYPTGPGKPAILFNPSTTFVEIHGQKISARNSLRESPFLEATWHCGGNMSIPADLNTCVSAIVTFDTTEAIEDGFTLHLDALEIDGTRYEVPDIRFCYAPRSIQLQHIHG